MATAARITNGDAASWQRAWGELARRVEDQTDTYRVHGAVGEARSAYLRACSYYRAPLFMMARRDADFQEMWQKVRC